MSVEKIHIPILRIRKKGSHITSYDIIPNKTCDTSVASINEEKKLKDKKEQNHNLIDIRKNYFSSPKANLAITSVLEELIDKINWKAIETDYAPLKRTHRFRALSVQKAVIAIKKYPYPITNYVQAQEIRGVGERIAYRIDEILKTGTLRELRVEATPFVRAVENLVKINGVGETLAKKLISNYQILDINDLRRKLGDGGITLLTKRKYKELRELITPQMEIGIKYFEDIQKKIPRNDITEMKKYLKQLVQDISPFLRIKICGSYRRHAKESGDIDILLVHPGIETTTEVIQSRIQYLKLFVEKLFESGFMIDTLSYGLTKFLGVARWKGLARRIDIIWTPRDSYFYALLYFTGNDILNRVMRTIALKKGYSLNNYGLYPVEEPCRRRRAGEGVDRTVNYKTNLVDEKAPKQYVTGEKIKVNSEREIFEILEIEYLAPHERN